MTRRSNHADVVAEFLRKGLAGGALGVPELEATARAAGLLGEHQRIAHAKSFKKAKKALGIQSVRRGFGADGRSGPISASVVVDGKRYREIEGDNTVASVDGVNFG
jgi:hypothetical protein